MNEAALFAFGVVCLILFESQTPSLMEDTMEKEWQQYKVSFNRSYSPEEELLRRTFFDTNMEKANVNNRKSAMHRLGYSMVPNKFFDRPEIYPYVTGFVMSNDTEYEDAPSFQPVTNASLIPESIDWSLEGAVTPVKDQGTCRSSWAFSATGGLEGQHFLKTGKLVDFSEQNVVDCSISDHGCLGGTTSGAFEFIREENEIHTEESYPYTGTEGNCTSNQRNETETGRGYTIIPYGDEELLKQAVATVGPISVAIDASDNLMYYSDGIYVSDVCSSENVDHAVLLVGYGHDHLVEEDYWILKNSWGDDWGLKGYFHLKRNAGNMCGIASRALYPNL